MLISDTARLATNESINIISEYLDKVTEVSMIATFAITMYQTVESNKQYNGTGLAGYAVGQD